MTEKKAVVLFSGGLDSTTCLAYAKAQGFECYALSFDYGQKHRAELEAAKRIAQQAGVVHRQIALTSLGQLGGSALTDAQYEVPEHDETNSIPITYVPARNTIMLAIALGWAEILNADSIFTGVSAIDYSNYPDCRPEYIQAFTTMANLATKRSMEGHSIFIETPLIQLSKAQTIELGLSLGVDYSQTVSCYRASGEGLACGTCPSCYLRKKGFLEAGVADVTRYIVTS